MNENANVLGKVLLNSIAQPVIAIAGASIVDAFFPQSALEEMFGTVAKFGVQSTLLGFWLHALLSLNISEGGRYEDPTGGVFLVGITFAAARNYNKRICKLSKSIISTIEDLIGHPPEQGLAEATQVNNNNNNGGGDNAKPAVKKQ